MRIDAQTSKINHIPRGQQAIWQWITQISDLQIILPGGIIAKKHSQRCTDHLSQDLVGGLVTSIVHVCRRIIKDLAARPSHT